MKKNNSAQASACAMRTSIIPTSRRFGRFRRTLSAVGDSRVYRRRTVYLTEELHAYFCDIATRKGVSLDDVVRVCLFCDDGPLAGRMKPDLVLSDVKGPVVIEVSAEVERSQFYDGFGH